MAAEDYVGPVGHEKKFHKTHFQGIEKPKLKVSKDWPYEWVKIGVGRYALRKKKNDGRK